MAASLPNEAEFGFWPPRFLKQKPVALFCFFTSPEGQLPRRGIVVIGAGPKICDLEHASVVMALAERGDKNNAMVTEASDRWTCLLTLHTPVLRILLPS